ncbi:hypothetical protein LTS18_010379, partial [Coniosporium uncinatum]
MPERVYTRFDEGVDDPKTPVPIRALQGQKRKREENATPENDKPSKGARTKTQHPQTSVHKQISDTVVKRPDPKSGLAQHPKMEGLQQHQPRPHVKHPQRHQQNGFSSAKPASDALATKRNDKRVALLETRKKLPIWSHAEEIRQSLRSNDVMLLVGETGSGKSTQVPQFLQTESWCTGCIAVTQPRRVAAISLARRVAEEVGTTLGSSSPASKVGYSVRFDNNTSPSTKVKFLTEGMLLQEMLRDAELKQYSCVVVDEVHERSVNVDLVLGFLKDLVHKRRQKGLPLKVVVMSATADMGALTRYFAETPRGAEGGANGMDSDTESSWNGCFSSSENERPQSVLDKPKTTGNAKAQPAAHTENVPPGRQNGTLQSSTSGLKPEYKDGFSIPSNISTCLIEGRQYPVKVNYLQNYVEDIVEAAL